MPRLAKRHQNVLDSSRTIIFGGTSGIGAAVSSAVLANDGKVFISSSSQSNINAAITHLKSIYPGADVSGAAGDLSNPDSIESSIITILRAAVEYFGGPLDHIVYTAGDNNLTRPPLSTLEAPSAFTEWNVRYLGPLMIAKILAANPGVYLKSGDSSSITLTSGILLHRPTPGVNAACVGAVEALMKSLSVDLAPIRTNTVAPGFIRTELLENLAPDMLAAFGEKSLVKRIGKPEEAAEAYLFCMRCTFLTGQSILPDGGYVYA